MNKNSTTCLILLSEYKCYSGQTPKLICLSCGDRQICIEDISGLDNNSFHQFNIIYYCDIKRTDIIYHGKKSFCNRIYQDMQMYISVHGDVRQLINLYKAIANEFQRKKRMRTWYYLEIADSIKSIAYFIIFVMIRFPEYFIYLLCML